MLKFKLKNLLLNTIIFLIFSDTMLLSEPLKTHSDRSLPFFSKAEYWSLPLLLNRPPECGFAVKTPGTMSDRFFLPLQATMLNQSKLADYLPWILNGLLFLFIFFILAKLWQYRSALSEIYRTLFKYLPESNLPTPLNSEHFKRQLQNIREALRMLKQQQVETEQKYLQAEGQHRWARQKMAELEQLLGENRFWQDYFWDKTDFAFVIVDAKNKIIKANHAFCQQVHLNPKDVINRPFTTIFAESDRNNFILPAAGTDQTVRQAAVRLWYGKNVWWKMQFHALPGQGNHPQKLIAIEDITDLMSRISELARREKHFQLLFNKANDPVFVNLLTPDHRFGRIIEVNQKAIDTYLYSREEFEYLNPLTLIPPEHRAYHRVITRRLLEERHVIYEIEYFRKDKRRIPVEINAHLFEYHNQPTVLSIVRDISERRRAQQALKNFSLQLRNLASRLQDIREEERTMIAREIHDELGQLLTVLKIEISLLCRQFEKDNTVVQNKVATISDLINQAVQTTQQITAKLRPGILDEVGLVAALEWQAGEFSKHTNIPCKIYFPDHEIELEKDKATALFRIFQEALTNIARHSQAERVSIFLKNTENKVILEIVDNGLGINRQQIDSPQSLGLLGMRERAMVFGGHLEIDGVAGQGTRVKVEIPLKE